MIRLPRWLDRERLLRAEHRYAKEKAREARLWFACWRNLTAELAVARVERDNARDQAARVDRYRIAWRHAYDRARFRRERAEQAEEDRYAADMHRRDVIEDRDQRVESLQRHLEEAIHRHNRLRDEYLTERARLVDRLAKYEGNPS